MKTTLAILFACLFHSIAMGQNLDELVSFIKKNPQKASVYLIENGKTTIDFNSNQSMPLASAAKTIIAIEFANQAAKGKINPDQKIPLSELAKYYIPNSDGQAHPNWLQSLGKSAGDSVTLLQVAKGMIKFSSNANTEYLQDLLGIEHINKNLKTLQLKAHQPLYYFTASALMVCLKPTDKNEAQWLNELRAMPASVYEKKCEAAHRLLQTDPNYIKQFNFANLSMGIQKLWSDRLVKSTTATYAQLMDKILSGRSFDAQTQAVLESILEWPMEFAGNRQMFSHLGQKGGSTSFVLTDAFYASLKNGSQLACAFFFNDLNAAESALVNRNFGPFEASILTNADFRKKLAEALAGS